MDRDTNAPLFSLLSGDGAGAVLASAAGDVAGGLDVHGYSALTQQATVTAYHLMRHGEVRAAALAEELFELDGDDAYVSVYREVSPDLRSFLDAYRRGERWATPTPSSEPGVQGVPIGLWYRRDPEGLVEAALDVTSLTHSDAATATAVCAVAAAVAASTFAQSGRDLPAAAIEVAEAAAERIARRFRGPDAATVPARMRSALSAVGASPDEVREALGCAADPQGVDAALLSVFLAAPVVREPFRLIESGALVGGSLCGALVGAMVGARVGIVLWPWVVPNDTWFAEIGRRLVRAERMYEDLPVPYAVEERLTLGIKERGYGTL
ncbi:MAG: ADP-ribosylglycohydrolase family protein [Acidimicrobiia bacterium]